MAARDDAGHVDYVRSLTTSVSPSIRIAVVIARDPVRNLRPQLRARRDLLLTSLREHAPDAHITNVPAGGLNLWARLPDATNIDRLISDCEAAGVMIAAGSNWFPAEPTGSFVRLNHSGPNPGAFADGARIIGQALAANH